MINTSKNNRELKIETVLKNIKIVLLKRFK